MTLIDWQYAVYFGIMAGSRAVSHTSYSYSELTVNRGYFTFPC